MTRQSVYSSDDALRQTQPEADLLPPEYAELPQPRSYDSFGVYSSLNPQSIVVMIRVNLSLVVFCGLLLIINENYLIRMFISVLGLVMLILIPVLFGLLRECSSKLKKLSETGRIVDGVVIGRCISSDDYCTAVAFKTESGQIISFGVAHIGVYKKFSIGETVRVRYVPGQPNIAVLEDF
jgi:hypothetical protein